MRREECDRIVDLVNELGIAANNCLREMLRNGPQRQAVSSVGPRSRLDVPGLLEFLPVRLPGWNRFYHDVIVRQIAYGNASDRGRTLLEILEILDPAVVPEALDEFGMSGDRSAAPPLIVMAGAGETEGRSPLLQLKAIEALGQTAGTRRRSRAQEPVRIEADVQMATSPRIANRISTGIGKNRSAICNSDYGRQWSGTRRTGNWSARLRSSMPVGASATLRTHLAAKASDGHHQQFVGADRFCRCGS